MMLIIFLKVLVLYRVNKKECSSKITMKIIRHQGSISLYIAQTHCSLVARACYFRKNKNGKAQTIFSTKIWGYF